MASRLRTTSKYRAQPVEVDGRRYASKREARRALELQLLARAGAISELREQVRYRITINGVKVCDYIADFVYRETGVEITEDCKGFKTPIYRLKKKLMQAVLGISIKET